MRSGKTEYSNYVFRNQLNYNNSFAEKHEISALAGIEISQYDTEGTVNPYVYGYNKEKNTSSVPPYGYGSNVDSFKNFFGNSATIEGGNTSYSLRCDRYVSYYTNIGYVYDGNMELLSVLVVMDLILFRMTRLCVGRLCGLLAQNGI